MQYGKTWWGKQWLNALSNIDNANRLPRGKTYANKGAVTAIEISGDSISAKVQGSRPQPYKVEIKVGKFTESEQKCFAEAVLSNPLLLAKLLNRQLPEELLQIAQRESIPLFPRSWRDFKMSCSCPDYAVPCKHLAAVIYLVAAEIDKNPFLVFELHGQDLLQLVSQNNLSKKDLELPLAEKMLLIQSADFQNLNSVKTDFDLSKIPTIGESLLALLSSEAVFTSADMRAILQKYYTRVAKGIKDKLQKLTAFSFEPQQVVFVELEINADFTLKKAIFHLQNEKSESITSVQELADFLNRVEEKHLVDTPSLKTLYWLYQLSKKGAQTGAFIPQLLRIDTSNYRLRYIPAMLNETVANTMQAIAAFLETPLVHFNNERTQTPVEQALTVVSLFLGEAMEQAYGQTTGALAYKDRHLEMLFFLNESVTFKGFGKQETPETIHQWLGKFYLGKRDLVPVLQIGADEDEFSISLMIRDKRPDLSILLKFSEFSQKFRGKQEWIQTIRDIQLLAEHFSDLNIFLNAEEDLQLHYNSARFYDFFVKIMPIIQLLGIELLLPNSLKHLVRPKATLQVRQKNESAAFSYLGLADLLEFDWRVALGDQFLSAKDFKALLKNLQGIVKIRDQYVLLEPGQIEKLLKQLEKDPDFDGPEALRILLAEDYNGVGIELSEEVNNLLKELREQRGVPLPKGLLATLRPYQQRGFEWLYRNARLGFGSIIADDMGLGKTLQVITTLLKFKEEQNGKGRPSLVIVPTTLLSNWQKELQRFAPNLSVHIYHGLKRKLPEILTDVIITTYGSARNDLEVLKKIKWGALVVDEAQNIKNVETEQTKAVKSIKADVRIAMSGTPVENRLSEYWSIFDFSNKGFLGSAKYFYDNFAKPIQTEHNEEKLDIFRRVTRPFILRRMKTDKTIISDLPDKIEQNQYCTLSKEQTALYESVVEASLKAIEAAEEAEGSSIQRQGLVLKMMMALKQICNHPVQYAKKGVPKPDHSGKMSRLLETLDAILENGEKTLIFSQFKEMGDLLHQVIEELYGFKPLFLHGGSTRKQRDEMVEAFQNPPHTKIFILSLKAGGTGLNLTAASNVIHYDLWWNPAVEAQATDRAYRIGQQRNVLVHRMITQGTLEEKIDAMLQDKKQLANLTVESGESWIGNLSNQELRKLVTLE